MPTELSLAGHSGTLHARHWPADEPSWIAVLLHGYGEHLGRYDRVAARLTKAGAATYAVDHVGHGRSDGERALIEDFDSVVADVEQLVNRAREEYAGLPVVLIGHSMGGLIATRYAQTHPDPACVVLCSPVLGRWGIVDTLLALDEIPEAGELDLTMLSRDPAVGAAYTLDELVWHGAFRRPTLEALRRCLTRVDAGGRLAMPVLWLHGDGDRLVRYTDSVTGWPSVAGKDAEERVFAGAQHELLNETNKEEVLDTILEFVGRHTD